METIGIDFRPLHTKLAGGFQEEGNDWVYSTDIYLDLNNYIQAVCCRVTLSILSTICGFTDISYFRGHGGLGEELQ